MTAAVRSFSCKVDRGIRTLVADMAGLEFRVMSEGDVGLYRRLVDLVGWGLSAADFERMLSYEPRGCFVAVLGGVDVGMVASFLYGEVGWIGNLIVLPAYREQGVGAALMRRVMGRLRDDGARSIRLDAVPKAVPLYECLGFRPEFRSLRFTGVSVRRSPASDVEPMSLVDLDEVVGLDEELSGVCRERMLRRVLEDFPRLCFVSRSRGRLVGYIMAKEGVGVCRIGPWICEPGCAENAEALLHAVMSRTEGERLWAGVPEANGASVDILRANGFAEIPSSLRMCHGESLPLGDALGVFGIGAAEKG